MRSPTSGASSTSCSPPTTRRRGWPPSSRSARPTSRADDRRGRGYPGGTRSVRCRARGPGPRRDHRDAGRDRSQPHGDPERGRFGRPMSLGNPDRPVGGLAVPRPEGVDLRPLARDDFADALALALELYDLDTAADPEPHRAAYEALVGDVDATPFLAIADGDTPAGFIVHRFRRRLNHATFEGWVSDLFVRERFRGRGIGRMLLDAALAEWRPRGGHQGEVQGGDERRAGR